MPAIVICIIDVVTGTVAEFMFMKDGENCSEHPYEVTKMLIENHRLSDLKHKNTEW